MEENELVEKAIQEINNRFETDTEYKQEIIENIVEEDTLLLVQQLIASDTGALSPTEIAYRNANYTEQEVDLRMTKLTNIGIVEQLEPVEVETGKPRVFYTPTEKTIKILKNVGLWEVHGVLYDMYSAVDTPHRIEEIENWEHRPTPEWVEE